LHAALHAALLAADIRRKANERKVRTCGTGLLRKSSYLIQRDLHVLQLVSNVLAVLSTNILPTIKLLGTSHKLIFFLCG
jgi:hypothetical protein